jgi:hypothetical protein
MAKWLKFRLKNQEWPEEILSLKYSPELCNKIDTFDLWLDLSPDRMSLHVKCVRHEDTDLVTKFIEKFATERDLGPLESY